MLARFADGRGQRSRDGYDEREDIADGLLQGADEGTDYTRV